MSLNVTLDINGRVIARYAIRRVTNTNRVTLDPDLLSQYEVCKYDPSGGLVLTTDVWHRYGDGAEKLLQIALEATNHP